MRGRLLPLVLMVLLTGYLLGRQILLPQPVIAFNLNNLILQQEMAARSPDITPR